MKVCLDLHDFSVVNNRLDLLLKLKEHFPSLKVSLFTVPYDHLEDWGPSLLCEDFLEQIKDHLNWLQFVPHGIYHQHKSEIAVCDELTFKDEILPLIQEGFTRKGLPYVKGFCAPHYYWNDKVVKVLDEAGWWGAIPRDKIISTPKRFYKFTHLLNEPFWQSTLPVLKLHGHVYGTKSDLGKCFDNLLKLPTDTEWHFVTDFIEEK